MKAQILDSIAAVITACSPEGIFSPWWAAVGLTGAKAFKNVRLEQFKKFKLIRGQQTITL